MTIPTDFETKAYGAINKDEEVRMRSSSGGMFHALAKWTIEQGGVVFGAHFDEKWVRFMTVRKQLKGKIVAGFELYPLRCLKLVMPVVETFR